jgi:hypothetical protein
MSERKVIVHKGRQAISSMVGINWKNFLYFVKHEDLPVYRPGGKGTYCALDDDLREWSIQQRNKYRLK